MGLGRARLSDPAVPKQAAAELREARDEIRELKDAVAKLAAARAPVQAPPPVQAAAGARANGVPAVQPYRGPCAAPDSGSPGHANGPAPAWATAGAGGGSGDPAADGEPAVHGAAAAAGMGVLPGAGPPLGEPPHPDSYMKVRHCFFASTQTALLRYCECCILPGLLNLAEQEVNLSRSLHTSPASGMARWCKA